MLIPSFTTVILSIVVLAIVRLLVKFLIRPALLVRSFRNYKNVLLRYTPILAFLPEMEKNLNDHNDIHHSSIQRLRENPDLRFSVWMYFDKAYVFFYDPELIKEVLSKQTKMAAKDPRIFGALNSMMRNGLVYIEGEKWKTQRKLVSQVFHFDYMNLFIPTINQICEEWIKENLDKPVSNVHLHHQFKKYTSGIVWRMFFGDEGFSNKEDGDKMLHLVMKNSTEVMEACFSPYNLFIGPKFLNLGLRAADRQRLRETEFLQDFVKTKLNFYKERLEKEKASGISSGRPKNLIELLLEDSSKKQDNDEKLSDFDIMAQIFTFVLAGTDTTSNLLIMANYLLAQYPKVQDKLREEVKSFNGEITYEMLSKMEYLNAVIKETLRLYGPADGIFPRVATEDVTIGDVPIKKGFGISCGFREIHSSPKYFSNPDAFRPERWIEKQDMGVKDPFLFLPFSAGGRRCIGEQLAYIEAKIMLYHLVRKAKIEIQKPYNLRLGWGLVYESKDPMTAIYTLI